MKSPTTNPKKAGRKRMDCFVTEYPSTEFTIDDIVKQSPDNNYPTVFQRIKVDLEKNHIVLCGSRRKNPVTNKGARVNVYRVKDHANS